MNFLRAYLEAIKILKTEREYSIKALAQFTRVQNLKAVQEGYDYFVKQLEPVPYPSVIAMQAVVDQIADLNTQLQLISPPPKLGSSLTGKLDAAAQAAQAGDVQAACGILQAFINEVQAQAGKKLSIADANLLIAKATQIQTVLGC